MASCFELFVLKCDYSCQNSDLLQVFLKKFTSHNFQTCWVSGRLNADCWSTQKKHKSICHIIGSSCVEMDSSSDLRLWPADLCQGHLVLRIDASVAVTFWGESICFLFWQQTFSLKDSVTGEGTVSLSEAIWFLSSIICPADNSCRVTLISLYRSVKFEFFAIQSSAWVWKHATACGYVHNNPL